MQVCSKCGTELKAVSEYCKKCGSRLSAFGAQIDDKKARVLSQEKKFVKRTVFIMGALLVVLAGIMFYIFSGDNSSSFARTNVTPGKAAAHSAIAEVKPENGDINIPIADLSDRSVHYYVYRNGHKDIKFFLLRDSASGIRAALDACSACYRAKLGYRQQGNTVICNNCGMTFAYDDVGKVTGGCSPIGVSGKVKGDVVVLKAKELEAGAAYF